MALTGIETVFLCQHMPDIVIRLAWQEWLISDIKQEDQFMEEFENMEGYFGLHRYSEGSNFFPASGAKGPFYYLLSYHIQEGLDFILELCNKSAEKYVNSDLDSPCRNSTAPSINPKSKEVKQIEIQLANGTVIKQYCSERLWEGYRGNFGLPALLQSALMALENWLIDFIEYTKTDENIELIFNHILRNSNSVMTTAVLASVATGFPDKLGKAALPILRIPELYDLDFMRYLNERGKDEINLHKGGFRHDPFSEIYSQERRKAALRPWRDENLENLILRLQFTDLREEVLAILDGLQSYVPKVDKFWRLRFHRIDTRGWKPEADPENKRIIFMFKNDDEENNNINSHRWLWKIVDIIFFHTNTAPLYCQS